MFIIALETIRAGKYNFLGAGNEFIIYDLDMDNEIYWKATDDKDFCRIKLNNYPVDKYRVTLKRKFNAVKINNNILNFTHRIRPMGFVNREDAERALDWVQSLQINAILTSKI